MIETVIGVVALFAAIIILFIKMYNIAAILKKKPLLDGAAIFFTLIGLLLAWGLYFLAFSGTLQYTQQIASATNTYVVTSSSYLSFAFFLPAMNFFLVLGILLTVLEVIAIFANIAKTGGRK